MIQEWVISILIALGALLLLIFGGFLYFCSKEGQRWAKITVDIIVSLFVLLAFSLAVHQILFVV